MCGSRTTSAMAWGEGLLVPGPASRASSKKSAQCAVGSPCLCLRRPGAMTLRDRKYLQQAPMCDKHILSYHEVTGMSNPLGERVSKKALRRPNRAVSLGEAGSEPCGAHLPCCGLPHPSAPLSAGGEGLGVRLAQEMPFSKRFSTPSSQLDLTTNLPSLES